MFIVNNKKFIWTKGLTISKLMKELETDKRFTYIKNFNGLVIINNKVILNMEFQTHAIKDGDVIKIVPVINGG